MEINGDPPPLIWPQFESTPYNRRRSSTFVPAMIGAISATVFLMFVIFIVPPILTTTSQILQPASVKRGWDSINVVLVVFAILCGVLARRNDDGLSSSSSSPLEEDEEEVVTSGESSEISSAVVSEQWFDDVYDADRLKIYESFSNPSLPVTGGLNLRRNSTSYPDLRNGVVRETVDRRFRFYDDFEIDKYRSQDSRAYNHVLNRSKTDVAESEFKEISVDKFVVTPPQQPPAPPQQPEETSTTPPPPPAAVEVSLKPRRSHRSVKNRDVHGNSKRSEIHTDSTKFKRSFHPPPSPPPPPPPPLVTATPPRKQGTLQRRKSNAAKEIKMVFASLYNQGKRKKKLQKSKRKERIESPVVVETVTEPQPQYQSSFPPPSPPPPPPPPPPPLRSSQSVFYGLFKKGVKSNKKIHSVPAPPPPPPPRKIQMAPQTPPRRVKSGRPPRPIKPTNFNEESYQGSPLNHTTPPPPPPPPFRVPPLKFVVSGDFAKIRSNQSSRCSSPEREVIDHGWGLELTQSDVGVGSNVAISSGTGFCPSPDVDTKADNFIARLRDEWRLDKMNSVKGKRRMGSV